MYQRKLLAVLSVDEEKRVRCQHPGCTKTIYRSIHVIEDNGILKVIGSTCIEKGGYGPFKEAAYTSTAGGGRLLTDEEREELANNTSELVQRLQAQYQARIQEQEQARAATAAAEREVQQAQLAKLQALKQRMEEMRVRSAPAGHTGHPGSLQRSQILPWPWVDPMRSILLMEMEDGTQWLRVQAHVRHGGRHHLVPFPVFDGWDEYLPSKYGEVNVTGDGYELTNLIEAIKYMRSLRLQREVVCGTFSNVVEATRR